MRLTLSKVEVLDQLGRESFFQALKKNIEMLKTSSVVKDPMFFGEVKISKLDYIHSLEKLLAEEQNEKWVDWISNNFKFMEVYGSTDWGKVMSTGYYEPKVLGSYFPTENFTEAIYQEPKDILKIDLRKFSDKQLIEKGPNFLTARMEGKKILPYYDRKEITEDLKLSNQKLELAYLNPIDAFFIQIQGSGSIVFPDGKTIRVGYANQNGYPYVAIGKYLKDVIPVEKMSMQRIKKYLLTLSPREQKEILNKNPSFVFFKKINTEAMTYSGVEVSNGRTVATDKEFFPKGALCFLNITEPIFQNESDIDPISFESKPRFVFDQDTGGAIKGAGHIDLYFGKDEDAQRKAGVMKETGMFYYLLPK
jgi:membrane-bound lytic murein transglycosylase A